MNDIAIIGAGGFGREVKCLIEDITNNKATNVKYNIIGYFDDGVEKGTIVGNLEVLGGIGELNDYSKDLNIALGVGNPQTKKTILKKIENKVVKYPNLVHPSVIRSTNNIIYGKGNIIAAGCVLTCDIELKDFITLNLCCTVGHDTVINSYSSFMPSVNISGEVVINEQVYVGTGATIINQVIIGEKVIVGAGAVVSKVLPKNCTAVGIPARPIKFH